MSLTIIVWYLWRITIKIVWQITVKFNQFDANGSQKWLFDAWCQRHYYPLLSYGWSGTWTRRPRLNQLRAMRLNHGRVAESVFIYLKLYVGWLISIYNSFSLLFCLHDCIQGNQKSLVDFYWLISKDSQCFT